MAGTQAYVVYRLRPNLTCNDCRRCSMRSRAYARRHCFHIPCPWQLQLYYCALIVHHLITAYSGEPLGQMSVSYCGLIAQRRDSLRLRSDLRCSKSICKCFQNSLDPKCCIVVILHPSSQLLRDRIAKKCRNAAKDKTALTNGPAGNHVHT